MHRLIIAAALLGSLAACSVNPSTGLPVLGGGGQDPLATLGAFTLSDLQNADQLAQATSPPDKVGHMCYAYLIPVVQKAQASQNTPGLPVSGAFSAFEAARIAIINGKAVLSGVPQDLNIYCAPLLVDANATILGLAAKVGIGVALPGTGGFLPTLGQRR